MTIPTKLVKKLGVWDNLTPETRAKISATHLQHRLTSYHLKLRTYYEVEGHFYFQDPQPESNSETLLEPIDEERGLPLVRQTGEYLCELHRTGPQEKSALFLSDGKLVSL